MTQEKLFFKACHWAFIALTRYMWKGSKFFCHAWGYHFPQPLANGFNEMSFNPLKFLGPLWRVGWWLCHPACFGSFRSGPSDLILINDARVNQNLPNLPIDEAFKPLYQKSENLVFFGFRAHKSVKQELADLRTQLGEKVELLCPSLIYYCIYNIHIYFSWKQKTRMTC